jgi:hypothetical protein
MIERMSVNFFKKFIKYFFSLCARKDYAHNTFLYIGYKKGQTYDFLTCTICAFAAEKALSRISKTYSCVYKYRRNVGI